jgi:hypothetical protein
LLLGLQGITHRAFLPLLRVVEPPRYPIGEANETTFLCNDLSSALTAPATAV